MRNSLSEAIATGTKRLALEILCRLVRGARWAGTVDAPRAKIDAALEGADSPSNRLGRKQKELEDAQNNVELAERNSKTLEIQAKELFALLNSSQNGKVA